MKEIEILKEISKGAQTGIDGLKYTIEKVEDPNLKDFLNTEMNSYQNIYDRSKELLKEDNTHSESVSPMQKAMSWMGIQLNTLTDASSSKIAEILIQGNDMGVVKGIKLLNNMQFEDEQIQNLLQDFVRLQQKNIDDLKKYL